MGPSVPYQREFATDDDPAEVVRRLFPPKRAPRRRKVKPLGELPSPFELLRGGPSEAAAKRLAMFGEPGVDAFDARLRELVGQGVEGGVSDSDAYWLGWLITQGEVVYAQGSLLEPPWDDSWDPEVGEGVVSFVDEMRHLVNGFLNEDSRGIAEATVADSSWVAIEQRNLDDIYKLSQEPEGFLGEWIKANEAGKPPPTFDFVPNPRTDAWYSAVAQAGARFSVRFLLNDGERYLEQVAYFISRAGEVPAERAEIFIANQALSFESVVLAQEGPERIPGAFPPRFEYFYHESRGGKGATVEEFCEQIYLER